LRHEWRKTAGGLISGRPAIQEHKTKSMERRVKRRVSDTICVGETALAKQ
jgi:hypothetical protein